MLQYSRIQENSADQAALEILNQTGQSPRGMLAFFKKLGHQEALLTSNQDPYVRTHPLTSSRIETIKKAIAVSRYSDVAERQEFVIRHRRMKAKLFAFLRHPTETLRKYPKNDHSIYGRFARAVAFHRNQHTQKAIGLITDLSSEMPNDPYFHEFHGQVLLESGHPADAVSHYERAVILRPNSVLLRIGLGQAQVAEESGIHASAAIKNLEIAVRLAPSNPTAWRLIGMAYGRIGKIGLAALATAERYILTGKYKHAVGQAIRAERSLTKGSPGWLRAQDLKAAAQIAAKKSKKK